MPFYNQAIPQPFTQSTPGQTLGEEITSLRVMFGTIMTKLNKLDNIEATIGDLSLSMEQLKTESAQVKTEVGLMKSEIKELKEKNKALEKRIIDNQSRSMRDNLVFYNVKEDEKFTEEEKVDTEAVLVKFIKEEMKVKSEIRFERVHRMGKAKQYYPSADRGKILIFQTKRGNQESSGEFERFKSRCIRAIPS